MLKRKILAAAAAATMGISSAAFAANWTGASAFPTPANDNWSNPFNWAGNSVPVSSPFTDVIFGQSNRLTPIQDMGNDFVIHNLVFNVPGYHLIGSSIAPAFIFSGSNALISNNISLPSSMTFAGEGSATLGGVLSGPGGLIMNSQGQLLLGVANTFTGTTQINSGQIVLGVPDALSKSTVIINSNNGLNLNNHLFPILGGLSGSGNLNLGDAYYDTAYLEVGRNNDSTTFSGAITTPGGFRWLEKVGTGALTLTGAGSNFYMIRPEAGAVVLSGGSINTTLALGDFGNSTPVTIQNGAVVDGRPFGDISHVGGNSLLRITGAGTIWRPGDARIAFFQNTTGNLIVENGATITDTNRFIVGQGGNATLLLQSGATITNTQGVIGQNSTGAGPAVGTATVTGNGSVWTNTASLNLGGLQAGVTGGTGILNINNGAAVISNGPTNFWTAPSTIKISGGTLTTASLASSSGMGSIELTDPIGGTALTINGGLGAASYSGAISGTGSLLKTGLSTQILSGNLTYLGPTTVNGGTLQISQSDLGNRSFRANPGGTILYNTPLITGGFLRGTGFHDFSQVQQIQGTTFGTDTLINQTTPLKLLNATISGTFNSVANLTADGVVISSAGTLNVLGAVTSQSLESNGVLRINATRSLSNTGTLVLGGGSRTFIGDPAQTGGQLSVSGGNIELNGALLVNNGTITGTTNINFGSLAKGAGVYGPVNVTDGGKFSPGNSPGSVTTGSTTWNSGGSYVVEIADALGGAGTGWDSWNIQGLLAVNSSSSANGRFTISLSTLDDFAANFHPTRSYIWPILQADDGIFGFDPSSLSLDPSGFKNPLAGGHFSLESTPTDLIIHFSAVPEPTTIALIALATMLTNHRRRSR